MISQVQQNIGIFISVIPGARMLRMVVMMLIEPMIDEAPMMCIAKIPISMPMPICVLSGAYSVQPAAGAPPGIPGSTNALRIHRMGDAINEVAPAYRREA